MRDAGDAKSTVAARMVLAAAAIAAWSPATAGTVPVPPGYSAGQVPIVFAGPAIFREYRTPTQGDAVVLVDNYVAGDGSYVAKLDAAGVFPVYDAGSPVLVTGVRMKGFDEGNSIAFTEEVCTGRMGLFSVYASNDNATWTLFWRGKGETISSEFETWLVRDPATAALTVYTNSVVANVYDDSEFPASTPYRYYRIEASPSSGIAYSGYRCINVSEFQLWTQSLAVFAKRPTAFASALEPGCGDDPDGATFAGTLSFAPAGAADIHACLAARDYGADYEAWKAAGLDFTVAAGVASGADFSGKAPNLGKGVYYTRLFAVSGDNVAASQATYCLATGTESLFPAVHQSGPDKANKDYDGDFGSYCDLPANGYRCAWVFDCSALDGAYPASIRFWPRKNSLHVERLRPRTAVVSVTADKIEWPDDETELSSSPREYFWRSEDPAAGVEWMQAENLSWTQIDSSPLCYEVAIPPALARKTKYVRIENIGFAAVREFEIRTLPKAGTVIIMF